MKEDQPKHEKIVRHLILDDGTIVYESESYYEQLDTETETHHKVVQTNGKDYVKDILSSFSHLTTDHTPVLQLYIRQRNGEPYEIVKKWVTYKKKHGKR